LNYNKNKNICTSNNNIFDINALNYNKNNNIYNTNNSIFNINTFNYNKNDNIYSINNNNNNFGSILSLSESLRSSNCDGIANKTQQ
jgi:uncharacterized UPF0146 family protein